MSEPVILSYLNEMNARQASDLYLTVGYPPSLRLDNTLVPINSSKLTIEDINEALNMVLTSRQKRDFEMHMELNTALDMGAHGRFRLNVLRQRQQPAMVIRRIVSKIPSFEDLRLPTILEKLSLEKRGLILFTGMTGSGKSTSLAAMVDYRNAHQEGHIITIEDPIEYFHEHQKSVITQREVGVDTESYSVALKNALRQRPDVILVGEIRDRDVMEQSLMASETGHLCLSTIHTNNAYQAIERVINLFPEDYASQIRLNLSMNLKAIISQRLLPSIEGGLTPAVEVMLNQGLVRELILKGEITQIQNVMEQNNPIGMCTFDQSLIRLYEDGLITEETAITNSDKPTDLEIKIKQTKIKAKEKKQTQGGGQDVLHELDTSVISLSD